MTGEIRPFDTNALQGMGGRTRREVQRIQQRTTIATVKLAAKAYEADQRIEAKEHVVNTALQSIVAVTSVAQQLIEVAPAWAEAEIRATAMGHCLDVRLESQRFAR